TRAFRWPLLGAVPLFGRRQAAEVAFDARGELLALVPDHLPVLLLAGTLALPSRVRAESLGEARPFCADQNCNRTGEQGDPEPAHACDSSGGRRLRDPLLPSFPLPLGRFVVL